MMGSFLVPRIALAAVAASLTVPVAAEPPVIPFHTAYTYWEHHWIQWLPTHPKYEAIEASVATAAGRSFTRVWFTERAPPKRQIHYFDDRDMAAAMRGDGRTAAIALTSDGADGAPRSLDLRFTDEAGADVHWRMRFAAGQRLAVDHAGLKPQGGHGAASVFLLWVLGPNATTYDSEVSIGGTRYAVTRENAAADGRYYGAAYTRGVHGGVFNYGAARVTASGEAVTSGWAGGRTLAPMPGAAGLYRSQPFGFAGAGRIELDAPRGLAAYRHIFGAHAMSIAFDPALSAAADAPAEGRYAIAFDGAASVLTGTWRRTFDGARTIIVWQPNEPTWARSSPIRSVIASDELRVDPVR